MKYRNTQKAILIVGAKESVQPFAITRGFTDKELEETPELRAAVDKGYLIPFDGKEPAPAPQAASPRQAEWQAAPDTESGTKVSKKVGNSHVEYIVADDVGVDGVSTGDPEVFSAIPENKSADFIEKGHVAQPAYEHVNAADAYERNLNEESKEAEFSDEDILAEKEPERGSIVDVDNDIAMDVAQTFARNKGGGSDMKTVEQIVTEDTSKALSELHEATKPNVDEGERVADGLSTNRVVDFMKQSFSSKKWAVSKETDKDFLTEVGGITKSENLKSLVSQRLTELG